MSSGGGAMERYRDDVLAKIRALKEGAFGVVSQEFPYSGGGAELVLLTRECAGDEGLMERLSRWREANQQWYPSQFRVTTEGTTRWFLKGVTELPDRLLFLVCVNGEPVGHVGLFRFDFGLKSCEIDNILRGEQRYPGIMEAAVTALMRWGAATLGLAGYTLQVFSDNDRAVRLYERIGYRETGRTPLVRRVGDAVVEWVRAPEGEPGERYYSRMAFTEHKKVKELLG